MNLSLLEVTMKRNLRIVHLEPPNISFSRGIKLSMICNYTKKNIERT
jgi:hypothetical protein